MAALVDRSLVRSFGTDPLGQPRYGLLETTRQVAADRLDPIERDVLQTRHAAWVADLVETAEQGIQTADADRWHRLLDLERYNLEAALDHAIASGDALTAQRIVGAVWRWAWTRLGGIRGLVSRMRAAIALPDPTPPRVRARALIAFGAVAQAVDGPERIEPALREAIDLLAPLGPSNDLAEAWCTLGAVRSNHGQLEQSGAAMEQALTIWIQTGDAQGQAKALSNLSVDRIQAGDRAGAIACVDRFLALIDETFEPVNRRDLHAQASQMLTAAGELERARDHLGIAGRLRLARPGDDLFDLLHLGASATLLERLGDAEAAVRAHAAARLGAARLGLHTDFVATLLEPLEPIGLAPEHLAAVEAEGRALLPGAAIEDAEAHLAVLPAQPRDATVAPSSDALA
jgi:tetratricopeptide (TPR) repeat protein